LYLFSKYDIKSIKQFAEAVSLEFGEVKQQITNLISNNNSQQIAITNNYNKIESIYKPSVVDSSSIGFTVNDTINTILQKIVDKFNNLDTVNSNFPLNKQDTTSIKTTLTTISGVKTIKSDVNVSSQQNNAIVKLSDGLYVNKTTSSDTPILALSGNKLSIVGSNEVTIPVQGLQTLSVVGNTITILGGNSQTLPSLTESALVANNTSTIKFTQSAINSHNISADAIISSNSLNRLSNNNGLEVLMNATDVIDQINNNNTIKASFTTLVNAVASNSCYRFFIKNSSASPITVNYVTINNVAESWTLAANSTYSTGALKITTLPSTDLSITFLGAC
jgi:hypothetical protein